MKLSKKESFVLSKWRNSNSEIRLTRSMCKNFINYFRKNIKKKCCLLRISQDYLCEKVKKRSVKFSVNNRCRASFATHCMHRMITLRTYETRAPRRRMSLNLHAAENFYSDKMKMIGKEQVAFKFSKPISMFSNFYKFDYKNNCDCIQYNLLAEEKVIQINKISSSLEPSICTTFLKPYMIDKDVLEQMNIKQVITQLFLPYIMILPVFCKLTLPIKTIFDSVLRLNKSPLRNISIELRNEYKHQDRNFPAYQCVFSIDSFILSGGLIPKLLNQTNTFTDVDIYIEKTCFDFMIELYIIDLKDTTGIKIWFENTKLAYLTESACLIERVLSLNKNSIFYKLLKSHLKEMFHPPQIIVYSRRIFKDADDYNTNRYRQHENLDKLVIDSYNIFNQFDIPMCRNALVFLNFDNYDFKHNPDMYKYPLAHKKYEILRNANIVPEVFNQFYNDKIDVQFANRTIEEADILKKYLRADYLELYSYAPYAVVGISYQSGPYRPYLGDQLDSQRKSRRLKYISRCLLNKNIGLSDEKKLNYNVPRLKLLAYNASQKNNDNIYNTCFCNPGLYEANYVRFSKKCSKCFNVITARAVF